MAYEEEIKSIADDPRKSVRIFKDKQSFRKRLLERHNSILTAMAEELPLHDQSSIGDWLYDFIKSKSQGETEIATVRDMTDPRHGSLFLSLSEESQCYVSDGETRELMPRESSCASLYLDAHGNLDSECSVKSIMEEVSRNKKHIVKIDEAVASADHCIAEVSDIVQRVAKLADIKPKLLRCDTFEFMTSDMLGWLYELTK